MKLKFKPKVKLVNKLTIEYTYYLENVAFVVIVKPNVSKNTPNMREKRERCRRKRKPFEK